MPYIGFEDFTDMEFVFSAGIAECTFGLLIFLGISTRFVALNVAFFFLLTGLMLGLHEIVGHSPILAMALVLITLGDGQRVKTARGKYTMNSLLTHKSQELLLPAPDQT